jgi:hypothetical protein
MASQAGAEKVGQLLDAKVDIVDKKDVIAKYGDIFNPKKEPTRNSKARSDFENVTFDYGNGVEVIHPLSLTCQRRHFPRDRRRDRERQDHDGQPHLPLLRAHQGQDLRRRSRLPRPLFGLA